MVIQISHQAQIHGSVNQFPVQIKRIIIKLPYWIVNSECKTSEVHFSKKKKLLRIRNSKYIFVITKLERLIQSYTNMIPNNNRNTVLRFEVMNIN